ncbi:esterase/lipase family protein [Leptospira ilyithenensis]|uniref:Alpha/beta hydrolase n=1 Tax=Leptospira ilyithenensis TaxID=2484901 RepID=A0A4R9LSQ4_9LEPT|nr:alpha/beta hydrolase [Leptospira ilyithenensis]TGN14465.1 alpha/beta hydrolase [Leptospira ilyithenensis]
MKKKIPSEKSKQAKKTPKEPINWKEKWETTKVVADQTATASVSILNGAFGNHLDSFDLASPMQFYLGKKRVSLRKEDLKSYPHISSKVCILVHGLGSDETMWKFSGEQEDYGTLLQKEKGMTPFYLRYNTGLHISDNGQALSSLLEELIQNSPVSVKEIVFISHSMGGLVTRSACYYGEKERYKWVSKTKKIFFIGSPHHGAGLEKLSNVVTTVLGKIPNPFTHLTKKAINLRSAGIKDLRYGYLVEEDWKGKDPDAFLENSKRHVPLMKSVDYYVITGTLTKNPNHPLADFFGDAIVGKWSSLGKSGNGKYDLDFPKENLKELSGINHLRLMYDRRVYDEIRKWCK